MTRGSGARAVAENGDILIDSVAVTEVAVSVSRED